MNGRWSSRFCLRSKWQLVATSMSGLLVSLLLSVIYWLIEESLVIHFYSNKNIFVHDFHTNSPKILPLDPHQRTISNLLSPAFDVPRHPGHISKTAKELHRAKEGAVKCILKTQPWGAAQGRGGFHCSLLAPTWLRCLFFLLIVHYFPSEKCIISETTWGHIVKSMDTLLSLLLNFKHFNVDTTRCGEYYSFPK